MEVLLVFVERVLVLKEELDDELLVLELVETVLVVELVLEVELELDVVVG